MPRQPQPVPPIFQPEVAAEAIVWAAEHPRRELMVGWPTVKAIVGNAHRPAARRPLPRPTGYDAQQTDEPEDPAAPTTSSSRCPGDQGAHGVFDARAHDRSLQLCASTHRRALVAGVARRLARGRPHGAPTLKRSTTS